MIGSVAHSAFAGRGSSESVAERRGRLDSTDQGVADPAIADCWAVTDPAVTDWAVPGPVITDIGPTL